MRLAVLQASFGEDRARNLARVTELVRAAAADGAQVILPPELFQGPYFPQREEARFFEQAEEAARSPMLAHFAELAKQLQVVLPISFFERDGQAYYNSITVFDADGANLGTYRKSHIPDGPGYEEKFYFRPGNTGFVSFASRYGRLGVGICWDQWFPECARILTLLGSEVLLYPTAIGSEPEEPHLDTKDAWQKAMWGHAVSNVIPVAAANRVGTENGQTFYGSSFVCNHRGHVLAELSRSEEGFAVTDVDLSAIAKDRASFGIFRDRRPDLYALLAQS